MNDGEFFREATIRICGSLDAGKALLSCLQFIRDHIPADRLAFTVYDTDAGAFITLAVVSENEVLQPKTWPVLPEKYRDLMNGSQLYSNYNIAQRLGDHDLSKLMTEPHGIGDFASLSLTLWDHERLLGFVAVHNTTTPGVFTPEHARKFELLREPFTIAFSNCLHFRRLKEAKIVIEQKYEHCRNEMRNLSAGKIIGDYSGLKSVMDGVRQVAHLDSPVIIQGETGTGKEMVADCIHELSPRRQAPLVKVNCGAIPPSLIDSHLFGHDKGAFTGAFDQFKGCFERADGGTIFLDEVGELPSEAQVRLLRVLQEKTIQRVGGAQSIKLDIRVIAATNRDLEAMMNETLFRKDLFFRINVFPIHIPPLRHRKSDLPLLIHHFLNKKQEEIKLPTRPSLAPEALDRIMSYDWPGNVRELENVVEREMIASNGQPLTFKLLQPSLKNVQATSDHTEMSTLKLDEVMSRHIERVLTMTGGRIHGETGAARLLNINPATLRKRMDKLGIVYGRRRRDKAEKCEPLGQAGS